MIAFIIFLLLLLFGFLAWSDILVDDEDKDYKWTHIKQKPDNIRVPSCYGKGYEYSVSCDKCWTNATCNCVIGADVKEN